MRYDERPAWQALLGWPPECEDGYQRFDHQPEDDGGVAVYPAADGQYLALVTCNLGPYWVEARAYWLDYRASLPVVRPLVLPELVQDDAPERGLHDVDLLHGSFPTYDPGTQTLTNLVAYRGLKDCGVLYTYHLEPGRLVLDGARYRACDDASAYVPPGEWALVYPPVAQAVRAGPFRRVVPLDPGLPGEIVRLEALPDGDLRLVTTSGYALLHDGAWQPHFLAPSQRFIGADAAGRLWYFPEEQPDRIYYWDGGADHVRADAGWLPLSDPLNLEGQGVLTDDRGQVWLATGQDVRVFAGGRWTLFTRETLEMLPPSNPDWGLAFKLALVAGKGQIWVGACDWGGPGPEGGGGARWLATSALTTGDVAWRGAQSYVAGGCVTAIASGAAGDVWVGMDRGLVWHFDPHSGDWQQLTLPGVGEHRQGYPLLLAVDPSGAPWVLSALCGGASCDASRALFWLRDGIWVEIAPPDEPSQSMSADAYPRPSLFFDSAETPWAFWGGWAFRVENERLQPPVAGLRVLAGTVDAAGRLWVAGQGEEDVPAIWMLEGNDR